MLGVLLWIWANIATVTSLGGLVALWLYWPRLSFAGVPVAALMAACVFLGGLGWGEQRYLDGRSAGAASERAQWERSFKALEAEKATEKAKAEAELADDADEVIKVTSELNTVREDLRIANRRLMDVINAQPPTETSEKADEPLQCAPRRTPYRVRVDVPVLRNVAKSRGQDGFGKNP